MGRYEQKRAAPARKKEPDTGETPTPSAHSVGRRHSDIITMASGWVFICRRPQAQVEPPPAEPQDDVTADNTSPPDTDAPDISTPTRSRKKNFYTMLLVRTMDDYNTDTIMLASVDAEADIVPVAPLAV